MSSETHGGNVLRAARRLGVPVGQITDFSANINPLGQPPGLREAVVDALAATVHYPEINAESLAEAIALRAGIPVELVLPGSGTSPLIYLLARVVRAERPLVVAPAFSEYYSALRQAGSLVLDAFCRPEDDFRPTMATVDAVLAEKPDLVFLCSPANPTGVLAGEDIVGRLLSESGRLGFLLVLDEAFMDFCLAGRSRESQVPDHPNLVVLKSLTKLFAVPGLRLGYLAAGDPGLMKKLRAASEPWAVNSLAQAAGLFLLKQDEFVKKTPAAAAALRKELTGVLEPYFELVPSDANFAAGRPRRGDKDDIVSRLAAKGILLRDLDNFHGMPPGHVRIAARPSGEIAVLKKALEELLP
ncbi:MAG: aminotransferase class I/II-fold pyridoxal phosphate-dependent enzyme [Deltaproteobacteria bacterium]|jgi:threonine-phosphate decarboxylase|nr:aminotransferase class I/II-fold pyridoxal phosphate-dependent enzyme [Deltaproteobacteria bacterium]